MSVRKIGVLRATTALGDLVVAMPALEALRAAYPRAEIVLLGAGWHPAFLARRPGPVDRTIVVPPSRGVRDELDVPEDGEGLTRFFDAMHREGLDLAIQLHGGGRHSNPFVLRLGARMTIGLKTPDAPPLDRWVPYSSSQSEVLRCLEVVSLVGAAPRTLEPRIAVTPADLAEAQAVIAETDAPLAALHPGATSPRRRWSPKRFAAVGAALAEAGARVLVTGAGTDRALVAHVVDGIAARAQGVAGRLSVGGLAGLLSRCAVVVANDTGPRHLAAAVGAPTVGIYWYGNLVNWGPLTRARHRPAVSWRLACPVCGADTVRDACPHDASLVDDVSTEEVVASALDLLAGAVGS